VTVDASGNVYVVGDTFSADFPSAGGFDTALGGGEDAFVTKINAGGATLAWSSYLGGSDIDRGRGVAFDASGNVYVVGMTNSSDFPSTGGFDTTLDGVDVFVTKVNAAGSSLAWSSFLGGTDNEQGLAVVVDGNNNPYVTGFTLSTDFPSGGGFDTTIDGPRDAFVTKLDGTGSGPIWSSYLGGSNQDEGHGVVVDGVGNVYVGG